MAIAQMVAVFRGDAPPLETLLLLALADHADEHGEHVYPSVAHLCRKTRLSESTVHRLLAGFRRRGWLIVTTPATAQRPTEYRLCLPEGCPPDRGVSLTGVPQTPEGCPPDTGGVSGTESRGVPQTPYPSLNRPEPSVNRHRRAPAPRPRAATQLPEPFPLTPERIAFAARGGVDAHLEIGKFRDHHLARGTLLKDWDAGWRTWCRRAVDFAGRQHGGRR